MSSSNFFFEFLKNIQGPQSSAMSGLSGRSRTSLAGPVHAASHAEMLSWSQSYWTCWYCLRLVHEKGANLKSHVTLPCKNWVTIFRKSKLVETYFFSYIFPPGHFLRTISCNIVYKQYDNKNNVTTINKLLRNSSLHGTEDFGAANFQICRSSGMRVYTNIEDWEMYRQRMWKSYKIHIHPIHIWHGSP